MSIAEDIKTSAESGKAGVICVSAGGDGDGVKVEVVYDIGTDHAFLPIWLVINDYCKRAAATDKKAGPLKKAAGNIAKYCVEDRVELLKGDGFDAVPEVEEGYYAVIAGVGGILLTGILERGAAKAKNAGTLALQPMNNVPYLRRWLVASGYEIVYEKLALESGRIYNLLFCKYTGNCEEYSDIEYITGKRFPGCSDEILRKYMAKLVRRFRREVSGILRIGE